MEEVITIRYRKFKSYVNIYINRVEFYNRKGQIVDTFYMHEIDTITYNIKFGFWDLYSVIFLNTGPIHSFDRFKGSFYFWLKKNKNRERRIKVTKEEYERIAKLIPIEIKVI